MSKGALVKGWIERARAQGLCRGNFVPFRYCTGVKDPDKGTFIASWVSWFPVDGELKRFEQDPENITDPSVTASSWRIEIEDRLNSIEEQEYRERIKSLSLFHLRWQRDLWLALTQKSPLKTPNGLYDMPYPPTVILPKEIHEKMLDAEIRIQKSPKPSRGSKFDPPTKHEFKYARIKVGVDRLLRALRLERPDTSLEEAKRIYAEEEHISYGLVNRLYHYKAKK